MGLEARLRQIRAGGRKILAPYLTAGFPSREQFPKLLEAVVSAGADMVEIGIPFSDPLMDGPVIQASSQIALEAGTTPRNTLDAMGALGCEVPFVYMTYVNPVVAMSWDGFAQRAAASGAAGVIIPDLPADEGEPWAGAAVSHGLEAVFLVAPTTTSERLGAVVRLGAGFVYCVSLLGVTGVRTSLSERAAPLLERVRSVTDRPALLGLGVSTPEHAVQACAVADGVIVGSAVIRAVLDDGVDAAASLLASMRCAIDA